MYKTIEVWIDGSVTTEQSWTSDKQTRIISFEDEKRDGATQLFIKEAYTPKLLAVLARLLRQKPT
jgi:hypothetical protein